MAVDVSSLVVLLMCWGVYWTRGQGSKIMPCSHHDVRTWLVSRDQTLDGKPPEKLQSGEMLASNPAVPPFFRKSWDGWVRG